MEDYSIYREQTPILLLLDQHALLQKQPTQVVVFTFKIQDPFRWTSQQRLLLGF